MDLSCRPTSTQQIRLFYPEFYQKYPSFFKAIEPREILTAGELRKTLNDRKISPISLYGWENRFHFSKDIKESIASLFGISSLFIFPPFIMYALLSVALLHDPVNNPFPLCAGGFPITDSHGNAKGTVTLNYPCDKIGGWNTHVVPEYEHNALSRVDYMFVYLALSLFSISMPYIAGVMMEGIKFKFRSNSINRFNEQLDHAISRLSYIENQEAEAPASDVVLGFPYLSDEQLSLLNFSQLKKIRKYWSDSGLFQKKLKALAFSDQQNTIWRLFEAIMSAAPTQRRKILKVNLWQKIIGKEPLFFQMLVRAIKPIDNKMKSILCDILGKKILMPKAPTFDLGSIVEAVADGQKLFKVASGIIQNLKVQGIRENQFQRFRDTGKLVFKDAAEGYGYYKLAKDLQDESVADYLETYLKTCLSSLLEQKDRNLLFKELTELDFESLKLSVEQHLNEILLPECDSDLFETEFAFAKDYDLVVRMNLLKQKYITFLKEENIFLDTHNAAQLILSINRLLNQIGRLFPDEPEAMVQLLKERIVSLLHASPETIENFADAALKNQNPWLIRVIAQTYEDHKDHFAPYWLTPFDGVIVNKQTHEII